MSIASYYLSNYWARAAYRNEKILICLWNKVIGLGINILPKPLKFFLGPREVYGEWKLLH